MAEEKRGLGIIFHSAALDRFHHGLSIALAALALGRPVRFFFTYWALKYLRRGEEFPLYLDSESREHMPDLERKLQAGHLESIPDLLRQAKALGGKFYTCTHSMGLLNIARDELTEVVDRSMGLTSFLTETAEDQLLFI